MANVNITVFEGSGSVAVEVLQNLTVAIDGANSSAITGSGNKTRICRFHAESACWVGWGSSPTVTDGDDSIPLAADDVEYFSLKAGEVVKAVTRS